MTPRKLTRRVLVGKVPMGGGAPVTVQSMLSVPAEDIPRGLAQARALAAAGCEILRAAVPDVAAVRLIEALKNAVSIPVVADIHFDAKLAIESVTAGADKIRINPGNIGGQEKVAAVARACRLSGVPIRIGVNSGSVERELLARFGGPTPQAMVESALRHVALLEREDFQDIVISLKSSDVPDTFEAYRLMAERCDYPLHLGVTESGTQRMGTLKSAAGIGGLLLCGIGDTIRVSLTADPAREVEAGIDLLRAVGLRRDGVNLISCPTCGRAKIDVAALAGAAEERLKAVHKPLRVAVMGCAVNGPGEAREADIGIAGGDGCGVLMRKGEILRKVPEAELLDALMAEIEKM